MAPECYNMQVEQRGMDVTAACYFCSKNTLVDKRVISTLVDPFERTRTTKIS